MTPNSSKKNSIPPIFLILVAIFIIATVYENNQKKKRAEEYLSTRSSAVSSDSSSDNTSNDRSDITDTNTDRPANLLSTTAAEPPSLSIDSVTITPEYSLNYYLDSSDGPVVYYYPDEVDLLHLGTRDEPISDIKTLLRYLDLYYRECLEPTTTLYLKNISSDELVKYLEDDVYFYNPTFIKELQWVYYSSDEDEVTKYEFTSQMKPERFVYNSYVKGIDIPEYETEAITLNEKVHEILDEIISPDMNALEIEFAIHDYIITHCAYGSGPNEYETAGCLLDNYCVCQGYAEAFQLLMLCEKIETTIVSGRSRDDNHCWNQVLLGKDWYNVDVTWDDPKSSEETTDWVSNYEVHAFLNITDEYLEYADHFWNHDMSHPANQMTYNYYNATGTYYSSYEEFQDAACRYFDSDDENEFECAVSGYDPDLYTEYDFIYDWTGYDDPMHYSMQIENPDYSVIRLGKNPD